MFLLGDGGVAYAQTPDLVVGSASVFDSSLATGASFTLSVTVTNAGDGASPATTLRYYQSSDATITTSDAEDGSHAVGALAAGATSDEAGGLTAPSTPGTYYYGACVDAVAGESDTTNNCSEAVTVTVHEPAPDLVVLGPNVGDSSPETGGTFRLIVTVQNVGERQAAATSMQYYRSTDATITTSDTSVGTEPVRALGVFQASAKTISLTAPSTAGRYYYGGCVDAVADESDTANNCSIAVQVDVSEPPSPPETTPPIDRAALVALYNATGGPGWTDDTNWLTDAPLGEWFGVEANEHDRVTGLGLGGWDETIDENVGNGLTGMLPAELGTLAHLRWLRITGNSGLTGPIPAELGDLANVVEDIELVENALTGSIPASLGRLAGLTRLALSGNRLTGALPAELGDLANLEWLFLQNNLFTGEIPSALGSLVRLRALDLNCGQEHCRDRDGLTGPIPAEFGMLGNLEFLNLSANALSGRIPPELGSLANLIELRLGGNRLAGRIPPELGNLPHLARLDLSRNRLTGPISSWLGNLPNLQWLYLYANPLTGPLPQSLTQLSLRTFWVHFTQACAPADAAFQAWVVTLDTFRGDTCGQAPTGSFTDVTLTPGGTGVRWLHVTELRQLVDTVRAVCNLPRAVWTDRRIIPGETPVRAVHLTELRTVLTEAYTACSLTPPNYTDRVIVRGMTPVKAVHWTELREAAIRALGATAP